MWVLVLVVVCSAVVSCAEEQGPVIYGRTVTEWAFIRDGLKKPVNDNYFSFQRQL